MYNAKSLADFIDKVNKEAEEAAQKVFDKYNTEFNYRIQAQLKTGDRVNAGMGFVSISNKKGEQVGEKLSDTLTRCEYWGENIRAGLTIEDFVK